MSAWLQLYTLTVPKLRLKLKEVGLKVGGSKQELVERLLVTYPETKQLYTASQLGELSLATLKLFCSHLKITVEGWDTKESLISSCIRLQTEPSNLSSVNLNKATLNNATLPKLAPLSLPLLLEPWQQRILNYEIGAKTEDPVVGVGWSIRNGAPLFQGRRVLSLLHEVAGLLESVYIELGFNPHPELSFEQRLLLPTWLMSAECTVTASPSLKRRLAEPQQDLRLLFSMYTEMTPPPLSTEPYNNERYRQLLTLPDAIIATLYESLYMERIAETHTDIFLTYRMQMALLPISPLEGLLLSGDQAELLSRFGIVTPPHLTVGGAGIGRYIRDNLRDYERCLLRPANFVPKVTNLEQWRDRELLDEFPVSNWGSRRGLIKIVEQMLHTPKWGIRFQPEFDRYAPANPDCNIFTQEPRAASEEDPLLRYGSLLDYRVWNLSELEGSFTEYDMVWRWRAPDFFGPDITLSEVQPLKQLLLIHNTAACKRLLGRISEGFRQLKDLRGIWLNQSVLYTELSGEEQGELQGLLTQLFLLGMTLRFWRGPGHEFPYLWREFADRRFTKERMSELYLSVEGRQRGSAIGFVSLLERVAGAPARVQTWLQRLPRTEYDFRSNDIGTVAVAQSKLMALVALMATGKLCISQGAEICILTAYCALRGLLHFDDEGINQLIRKAAGPGQPLFEPGRMDYNGHRDGAAEERVWMRLATGEEVDQNAVRGV